jgi:nucleotide-sensitive chloride channel 1A
MATLIPTTIHASPSLDSFTTLTDYQSQTPASFQSDRPILHYHAEGATALQDEPQEHILSIWDLEQIATEEDEFKPLTQAVDVFVSDQYVLISLACFAIKAYIYTISITNPSAEI